MERWVTATTPTGIAFERASQIVCGEPASLLPARRPGDAGGQFVTGLSVETKGGAAVRQDVVVTFGAPCSAEGETWVPIEWEPIAHAALLPSFSGVLELVDGAGGADLAITGIYQVPLGVVGHFGDGLLGRRIAQQSIRSLLDAMATQLRSCVADELMHASWKPAPYPISLRERPVPDYEAARGAGHGEPSG